MKLLNVFLVLLLSFPVWAQSQDPRIKSWKTLTNDNGFEFKYPDCWTVRPDNPDEMEQPVTQARDIAVQESTSCARPLLNPPHQNGVGFRGGWHKTTKEESLNEIERRERNSKNDILRKELGIFKRLKIGSNEAIARVRIHKDVKYIWIGWEMDLYCPTQKVSWGGPSIKDPDPSYFEKFKAGDIALPEPEKTIFESIRCTKVKK